MSKVRNYINENYDIRDVYKEVFGKSPHTGKIFCPFHDNKNTPAAKIYGNIIRCFSCNRSYTSHDLLMKYLPQVVEQIKETVLMDEKVESRGPLPDSVRRKDLNLNQGIVKIIEQLCQS